MISAFAVRLIAQQCLVGQTWAGERVLNSPIEPLSGLVDVNATWSPVVAIFSTMGTADVTGQDMTGRAGTCGLMIQLYVPPAAVIVGADGATLLEVQGKGALAAFVLDTMAYQIHNALLNPTNPWADLWARFVVSIKDVKTSPPFLEEDDGLRVPAMTIEIDYQPLSDPIPGRPMTPTFAELHARMSGQSALAPLAEILKQAIEQPSTLPDWSRLIMQLGLAQITAVNVGIAPLPESAPADQPLNPATLDEIDVYSEPNQADVHPLIAEGDDL